MIKEIDDIIDEYNMKIERKEGIKKIYEEQGIVFY